MEIIGYDVVTSKTIAVTIHKSIVLAIREVDKQPEHSLTYVCRGFVDLQVNGYAGFDYSGEDLSVDGIEQIVRFLARGGTTRHAATIITSTQERIIRNARIIAEARRNNPLIEWAVPFVHIEGPYISASDGPRGAHDAAFVRDPNYDEYREWQEASHGIVKIVTIAPERRGAIQFIERVSNEGVIVSLGHTEASPHQIRDAIAAGATMSTHLGNGSHAVLPRHENYIWEQLGADELSASIICDGFHLPAAVMRVMLRTKPRHRLLMVSDVGALAGCPSGIKRWGTTQVEVHSDGHLSVANTPYLAGAGHLLNRGLVQFCRATGADLHRALELCITNPSMLVGFSQSSPSLNVGDEASIVQFTIGEHEAEIRRTITPTGLLYEC